MVNGANFIVERYSPGLEPASFPHFASFPCSQNWNHLSLPLPLHHHHSYPPSQSILTTLSITVTTTTINTIRELLFIFSTIVVTVTAVISRYCYCCCGYYYSVGACCYYPCLLLQLLSYAYACHKHTDRGMSCIVLMLASCSDKSMSR